MRTSQQLHLPSDTANSQQGGDGGGVTDEHDTVCACSSTTLYGPFTFDLDLNDGGNVLGRLGMLQQGQHVVCRL
jgi:hypothetical protein